jgi:hypothetical protein
MVPRPEDSPVTLALYLSSPIPFAVLVPNDLLASTFSNRIFLGANHTALKEQFQAAGKLQILSTQMTWVVRNVPEYKAFEMFRQALRTPAPVTCNASPDESFQDPVPASAEDWIHEQTYDPDYVATLGANDHIACRNGLYLYAPDQLAPRILFPPQTREPLIRFTHDRMFHLGHAKSRSDSRKVIFGRICVVIPVGSSRIAQPTNSRRLNETKRMVFSAPSPSAPRDLVTPWTSRDSARR